MRDKHGRQYRLSNEAMGELVAEIRLYAAVKYTGEMDAFHGTFEEYFTLWVADLNAKGWQDMLSVELRKYPTTSLAPVVTS